MRNEENINNTIRDIEISGVTERAFISSGLSTMTLYDEKFYGENIFTCHEEIPAWVEERALNLLQIDEFTDSEFILFAYFSFDKNAPCLVVTQRRIAWNDRTNMVFLIENVKGIVFEGSYNKPILSFLDQNDRKINSLYIDGIENIDVFKDSCRYFFQRIYSCILKIDDDSEDYMDFEEREYDEDDIRVYSPEFTDRVNDKICEICNSVRLNRLFYSQGAPIDMTKVKNVGKLVEQYDNEYLFQDYFFLLYDSTSFSSWKKGVLIASSGIYVNGEDSEHYLWTEINSIEIYCHMSALYINGESVGNGPDTDKLCDILNKLKIELTDMFYL